MFIEFLKDTQGPSRIYKKGEIIDEHKANAICFVEAGHAKDLSDKKPEQLKALIEAKKKQPIGKK